MEGLPIVEGLAIAGIIALRETVPLGNRNVATRAAAAHVMTHVVAALLAYLVQTAHHHRLQHPLQRFLFAHPSTAYGMLASVHAGNTSQRIATHPTRRNTANVVCWCVGCASLSGRTGSAMTAARNAREFVRELRRRFDIFYLRPISIYLLPSSLGPSLAGPFFLLF